MTDNIRLNQGAGGDLLATIDRGGAQHQRVLVRADDSASVDAFSRWRTSEPHTLFDSKLIGVDDAPLFWDEQLESGAGIAASTPTAAKPYIDFTSTLNTAGRFTRQTFRHLTYQSGKSQLVLMTGVLDLSGGGAGVERRIGMFNDDNGLFFEDDAGTVGVTVRSNDTGTPVDTTVTQANWNVDTLDGSGDSSNPSGFTVDWTKNQIFVIDFQWLGLGRVRFGVDVDGFILYVHNAIHANTTAIPYMSTPNLPLRYQMITTGVSPVSEMRVVCSAVISEGGAEPVGVNRSHATTDHVNANATGTVYALLGIRLKAAQVGCDIDLRQISILSETNDDFEWLLIHNAAVAGTFDFSDLSNSCVQTATGSTDSPSTNTVTGGVVIGRGFGKASGSESVRARQNGLRLGVKIDGTLDTLVLAVRGLSSNADFQGSLIWQELT